MDPISAPIMAGISMATTAASTAVGVMGNQYSADAQSNMWGYRAGIANLNREISRQNAAYARSAGEVEAQREGLKTRGQIGEIAALQGASNIDVRSGSHALVRSSAEDIGRYDQAIIRSNAARRAYGYELEGVGHQAEAELYKASADNAKAAGKFAVASTILGGISSISDKWLKGKEVGLWA